MFWNIFGFFFPFKNAVMHIILAHTFQKQKLQFLFKNILSSQK